jgi:hypothetical protein
LGNSQKRSSKTECIWEIPGRDLEKQNASGKFPGAISKNRMHLGNSQERSQKSECIWEIPRHDLKIWIVSGEIPSGIETLNCISEKGPSHSPLYGKLSLVFSKRDTRKKGKENIE